MGALLLIQLPANTTGEAAGDGPSAWDPATHAGKLDRVPGLVQHPLLLPFRKQTSEW